MFVCKTRIPIFANKCDVFPNLVNEIIESAELTSKLRI